MVDDPPTVAYAAGYIESHGADDTSSERQLWLAVLRQAADDLRDSDPAIRQDAAEFFKSDDLLEVLSYAGISTSYAPLLRERARAICQQPGRRRRVMFRGETRTIEEWGRVTGVSIHMLSHWLRRCWSIKRALETPSRR